MSATETKATHTPAPWAVDGEGAHVARVSSAVEITAPTVSRFDRPDEGRIDADARLIAASPDLLECLRRMCGMYGAYSRRLAPLLAEDDGTVWTFERANSLALEAIAKAEGR